VHPHHQQSESKAWHDKYGIQVEAWAPMGEGRGGMFELPELKAIGDKYGKTPAQVILRWHLQRGIVIIPKSTHIECMRAYLSAGEKVFQYPLMTYQCETIEDICIASLHFLITHKFHIRKCKNCSRYFVAYNRSDTEYCDRQSPYGADKTCKEDGPGRTYRDAMNVDQVKKIFYQIDSARRMRVSRHPDDEDIRKEYAAWQKAMRRMRNQYKNGAISADRYVAWLEKHKAYTEDWDYEKHFT